MRKLCCCGYESATAGPAELTLAAYRRLLLKCVDWQRLAGIVAGPLVRRHRLRAGSVRLWLDAVSRMDCRDETTRGRKP